MKIGRIVRFVLACVLGFCSGCLTCYYYCFKQNKDLKDEGQRESDNAEKFESLYKMSVRWMNLKSEGREIKDFLKEGGYASVAIYGMGDIGKYLAKDLKSAGVNLQYAIDRGTDGIYSEIKVVSPAEQLEPVDIVIVTATHYYDEIKADLQKKMDAAIVSLDDILLDL